ncbi:MAG: hypothetical protein H7Y38_19080 [Armatimonadetes bacterium]|nr:hypothetical protein [Armatimonadota bacterium]
MGVYFALRTHYEYPTGKYLRHFPDDKTVLSWFQKRWQGFDDEADSTLAPNYAREIVGADVYGFDSLFAAIAEHNLPVPKTERQLAAILQEHLYVEGEILASPHVIQVLTDDDELELAYYFFDDDYLAKNADKAAYLLYDDWRLPASIEPTADRVPALPGGVESLAPVRGRRGTVYAVFLTFYDSSSLTDIQGAYRIGGIRLPQFSAYLAGTRPTESWLSELLLMRTLAAPPRTLSEILGEITKLEMSHLNFSSDWEYFRDATVTDCQARLAQMLAKVAPDRLSLSRDESLLQTEEHIAQLCLQTGTWDANKLFTRWIFFDDLWLRANPVLGKAMLRFGTRWDVLT